MGENPEITSKDYLSLLTYQAANALRAIPDYFEAKGETVGLAFVGNPCFYNKFNGKYTSDRVQVSSRFVTE